MKVGIISESPVDEAAIQIIAQSVLGGTIEVVQVRTASRGWTSVLKNLPGFYKHLHWHSDAYGLIAVIDSDDTMAHDRSHASDGYAHDGCRYCKMYGTIEATRQQIGPRPYGRELRVAIGLSVPAIEAWYLCGEDVHIVEAKYRRQPLQHLQSKRRDLKSRAYGRHDAPTDVMLGRAREWCAKRAAQIDLLERHFPDGFGPFIAALKEWRV